MMKKFMLILALLVVVCSFASAEESTSKLYSSGDYEFMIQDDGTAKITLYKGKDKKLVLPNRLGRDYVVSSIGSRAFANCTTLTNIVIPDNIVRIDKNPFYSCTNLVNIQVSPDHPSLSVVDSVLFDKNEKKLICYFKTQINEWYEVPDGIRMIGDYAFHNRKELQWVYLPQSITSIGECAFSGCKSLYEMTIPDGVTNIGEKAFMDCVSLHEISMPNGLDVIKNRTFYGCESLEYVDLPNELSSIEEWAFANCKAMKYIGFPKSVSSIGDKAFYKSGLLGPINLPVYLTEIADSAFDSCPENVMFEVEKDSYAAQWCKNNGMNHIYPNSLDWLNELYD